jgi:CHAD domain-containing protein
VAKARDIPGIEAALPFREAAARVLEIRAQEVFDNAVDVLDTGDIERVHDMRVSTRRLRAVMEIFAPAFPRKPHERALADVKELADALGERRDPDVAIDALAGVADALHPNDSPGIVSLQDDLRSRQERANEHLAETLERVRGSALRERLLVLAAEARGIRVAR